jgi:hypothetical protein
MDVAEPEGPVVPSRVFTENQTVDEDLGLASDHHMPPVRVHPYDDDIRAETGF